MLAGGNLQRVADDLGKSRATIQRWLSREPPPSHWSYRLILDHIIEQYRLYHTELFQNTRSYKRDASRMALSKLHSMLPELASPPPLATTTSPEDPDQPLYDLYIRFDGEEGFDSSTALTLAKATQEAQDSANLSDANQMYLTLNGKTERLSTWRRTSSNQFQKFILPEDLEKIDD